MTVPSVAASRFPFVFQTGDTVRKLYATDASEYQEVPEAVAFPECPAHVQQLVLHARANGRSLIPRAAGTSLAGQVVGGGIVVDAGRHMHRILGVDAGRRRVRVEPGVVRDELNRQIRSHGLFFGPETSTANRAMIGGMVGNNSCGANSIVYGSVRDHLVSARGFLSDGSEVEFRALEPEEFAAKCEIGSLEGRIYRCCRDMLGVRENRALIRGRFPKPSIPRRNTGYALDLLMDSEVFDPDSDKPFNLCRLIAGSEGTLFFGVEFELHCDPLPPPHSALVCAHFGTIDDALRSVVPVLAHGPFAVELIDRFILDATKRHREHRKNRFFVEGDPGAILVIDLRAGDSASVDAMIASVIADIRAAGHGYAFPVLRGDDEARVWELRKAGQGLMANIPGDAKPRENVEDTAVAVEDLADYIAEFDAILKEKHGKECVYYAHAGSGEIHTRPLFDLKTAEGLKTFRVVAEDVAQLVKKYNGSLSGEHGDGRLRGEFIPFMVGEECYALMREMKEAFDPGNVFNPGKIIDTPPMDASLRHGPGRGTPEYETIFDFSESLGLLRAAEQCTGSGDCRKGPLAGGTMCPSYQATRDESHSTRARANILRHALTNPADPARALDSAEIGVVMDLCLSCKACKSECPSNVDMTKLKAEFQQHFHDANGVPLRTRLIANFAVVSRVASLAPRAWNALFGTDAIRRVLNRMAGFHPERSIPRMPSSTMASWFARRAAAMQPVKPLGRVHLFLDEFTNFNDAATGRRAVELLTRLGYEVVVPDHLESARTWLSKGLVRKAREIANENVRRLAPVVSAEAPLVGIEPSAILGFRDEYIDLAAGELRAKAERLAKDCLMLEEFLVRELESGRIDRTLFTKKPRLIRLHGHCFQKALASMEPTVRALEIPANYKVQLIPSGCCGMAGSFGYEREHYEVSMKIGELVLFPEVRGAADGTIIAASGTSCRHQIRDGTGRTALHPAEILREALD